MIDTTQILNESLVSHITEGIAAGIAAGILMGIVSDVLFRINIFRSSMINIDGLFIYRYSKNPPSHSALFIVGLLLHLFTSALFGGIYIFATNFLNIEALTPWAVALYFFVLWLSMLFIALPVAGQGFLGKKVYKFSWLEQLILHIVFGTGYFYVLKLFS